MTAVDKHATRRPEVSPNRKRAFARLRGLVPFGRRSSPTNDPNVSSVPNLNPLQQDELSLKKRKWFKENGKAIAPRDSSKSRKSILLANLKPARSEEEDIIDASPAIPPANRPLAESTPEKPEPSKSLKSEPSKASKQEISESMKKGGKVSESRQKKPLFEERNPSSKESSQQSEEQPPVKLKGILKTTNNNNNINNTSNNNSCSVPAVVLEGDRAVGLENIVKPSEAEAGKADQHAKPSQQVKPGQQVKPYTKASTKASPSKTSSNKTLAKTPSITPSIEVSPKLSTPLPSSQKFSNGSTDRSDRKSSERINHDQNVSRAESKRSIDKGLVLQERPEQRLEQQLEPKLDQRPEQRSAPHDKQRRQSLGVVPGLGWAAGLEGTAVPLSEVSQGVRGRRLSLPAAIPSWAVPQKSMPVKQSLGRNGLQPLKASQLQEQHIVKQGIQHGGIHVRRTVEQPRPILVERRYTNAPMPPQPQRRSLPQQHHQQQQQQQQHQPHHHQQQPHQQQHLPSFDAILTRDPSTILPDELQAQPNDLKFNKKLGQGGAATVWLAQWRGSPVAVKILLRQGNNDPNTELKARQALLQELKIWAKLRHPNLVLLMGASLLHRPAFLIAEFCAGGSLFAWLHEKRFPLTIGQKLKIAADVARGCLYLHTAEPAIIHRDLKSLNILMVDENPSGPLQVKIADFGLSSILRPTSPGKQMVNLNNALNGTTYWMAPELFGLQPITPAVDVFAFAVVLYELLAGRLPYEGQSMSQVECMNKVMNGMRPDVSWIQQTSRQTRAAVQLMEDCWVGEPRRRPTFSAILDRIEQISSENF